MITCWGEEFLIPENLKPIIASRAMQRLKDIAQLGPPHFWAPKMPKFTRYEHSLEVWALLVKNGAPLDEQIAGLLHDASHTVFSHVGDFIFAKDNILEFTEKSYQDTVHEKYLESVDMDNILKPFGLASKDLNPECGNYSRLEQLLPDMCADRIQYNIKTGLIMDRISEEDAKKMENDLSFQNGKWFFKNKKIAQKFAELSLYFTQNFYGAKWAMMQDIYLANAMKRALAIGLIANEDLFLTDTIVMEKLTNSQDKHIQENLYQCQVPLEKNPNMIYKKEWFKPKFRGIDPLVFVDGELVRLTKLDMLFENYYHAVKKWCNGGFEIEAPK